MKKKEERKSFVYLHCGDNLQIFFDLSVTPGAHECCPSGCSLRRDSGVIKTGPIVWKRVSGLLLSTCRISRCRLRAHNHPAAPPLAIKVIWNPTPSFDSLEARQPLLWHPWQRDFIGKIIVPLLIQPNNPKQPPASSSWVSVQMLPFQLQDRHFLIVRSSATMWSLLANRLVFQLPATHPTQEVILICVAALHSLPFETLAWFIRFNAIFRTFRFKLDGSFVVVLSQNHMKHILQCSSALSVLRFNHQTMFRLLAKTWSPEVSSNQIFTKQIENTVRS